MYLLRFSLHRVSYISSEISYDPPPMTVDIEPTHRLRLFTSDSPARSTLTDFYSFISPSFWGVSSYDMQKKSLRNPPKTRQEAGNAKETALGRFVLSKKSWIQLSTVSFGKEQVKLFVLRAWYRVFP